MSLKKYQRRINHSFCVYDAENIYVCDTGILPASPGANPMLPTMALVHQISEHIAQHA